MDIFLSDSECLERFISEKAWLILSLKLISRSNQALGNSWLICISGGFRSNFPSSRCWITCNLVNFKLEDSHIKMCSLFKFNLTFRDINKQNWFFKVLNKEVLMKAFSRLKICEKSRTLLWSSNCKIALETLCSW